MLHVTFSQWKSALTTWCTLYHVTKWNDLIAEGHMTNTNLIKSLDQAQSNPGSSMDFVWYDERAFGTHYTCTCHQLAINQIFVVCYTPLLTHCTSFASNAFWLPKSISNQGSFTGAVNKQSLNSKFFYTVFRQLDVKVTLFTTRPSSHSCFLSWITCSMQC